MAERTKWTPEMVERLHELWNRNFSVLEIAQEMGLPFEVVKSKISNEKTKEKKAEKGFTFKLEPDAAPAEEPEPDTPHVPQQNFQSKSSRRSCSRRRKPGRSRTSSSSGSWTPSAKQMDSIQCGCSASSAPSTSSAPSPATRPANM